MNDRKARAEAKEKKWQEQTEPVRQAHVRMMARAWRLTDADLSPEEIATIVNYVYEQTLAHLFAVLKNYGRRRTLALDIILLESIILLGHGPNRDELLDDDTGEIGQDPGERKGAGLER